MKIFAVLDDKAGVFANPYYMSMKGEAIRAFQDVVTDERSMIYKHPEDFSLYCLGEYDNVSGKFVSLGTPEFIVRANDFSPKEKGKV